MLKGGRVFRGVATHDNIAEREMKRVAPNRKNSPSVGNEHGGRPVANSSREPFPARPQLV